LAFRRTVWYRRRDTAPLLNAALTFAQSEVYHLDGRLPFTLTPAALAASAKSSCKLLTALSSSTMVRGGGLSELRARITYAKPLWQRSGTTHLAGGTLPLTAVSVQTTLWSEPYSSSPATLAVIACCPRKTRLSVPSRLCVASFRKAGRRPCSAAHSATLRPLGSANALTPQLGCLALKSPTTSYLGRNGLARNSSATLLSAGGRYTFVTTSERTLTSV